MKKLLKTFTGQNLLFSLGLSLAGYLIGPVVKEIMLETNEQRKDFYQLEKEKKEFFVQNKKELN
ncbi:hypothetical protein JCM16358_09450 [Halanaerocella petrolearia]